MPPEEAAPDSSASAAHDITFAVEYDEFAGQSFPADRRCRGRLEIGEPGPAATFTFFGPSPPSLSLGEELEFAFPVQSIRNVEIRGNRISFSGTTRSGLAEPRSFFFHCVHPEDTAKIARLLPSPHESPVDAAEDFETQLDRLPAAHSFWTSMTGLIVLANLLAFVAMGFAGAGWFQVASMQPYMRFGANQAIATTDGQWWRLVTSMFLHYGILHLLLNMWALFQAGQLLEKLTGRALYVLVYFGSGICGSLATLVWHGKSGAWSAGASGAVFGIYGALTGYILRQRHALPERVWRPILKGALAFAGYNLVFGLLMPQIDNAAHFGGLCGGCALGALVAMPLDLKTRQRLLPRRLILGTSVLALAMVIGIWAAIHRR